MGKTEHGAVFLDPERVSPYDFFQYWRNVPDVDVRKFFYLYTFLTPAEIETVVTGVADGDAAAINTAKERLAREITALIHGETEADKAVEAARALFSGAGTTTAAMPGSTLPRNELSAGIGVLDLFVRAGLCGSKGEARRLVQQGGARINNEKIDDVDAVIGADSVDTDDALLLRAGKKRYYKFDVT